MDWLWAAGAASVVGSGAVGMFAGLRLAGRRAAALASRPTDDLEARRLRARAREAAENLEQLRGQTSWLATLSSPTEAITAANDRRLPSLVVLRLQGLTNVREAFVAGTDGLVHSRTNESGRRIAALTPTLHRVVTESSVDWLQLSVDAKATFWTIRRLPSWARGAVVFASSTGSATNELALDAAVWSTLRGDDGDPRVAAPSRGHYTRAEGADAHDHLERALEATPACSLAIVRDGRVTALATADGVSVNTLHDLARATHAILVRAQHLADGARAIDLLLRGGLRVALMPLHRDEQLLVVSPVKLEDLDLRRLCGSLARSVAATVEARAS